MESRLVELYKMETVDMVSFLDELSEDELIATARDYIKCLEAIKKLEPMYKELEEYRNKFYSKILKIWWFFNRNAKEKALSEYNAAREKALAIWKNPEISLEKLLDIETVSIAAKYRNIWDKESDRIVSEALLPVAAKLVKEISPHLRAKVAK